MWRIAFARRFYLALLLSAGALIARADRPEALNARSFAKGMPKRGVVIFEINWGRKWGCAGIENAQLERLTFTQLPLGPTSTTLDLKTPSKLFVKDQFLPYAYVVDAGKYAISSFDVKISESLAGVGHILGTKAQLFDSEIPKGGTFEVTSSEVVYIGHFGLDCAKETIPWRYYVEDKASFESLVSDFGKHHPFASSLLVRYQLFDTTMFGRPYSLPDEPAEGKAK
jgi:hypothetical protein